ncbi:MAG: hypothetical protein JJU11_04990 [Candidatus Sumerlaeia bacterium]|nr:hypothetical protein [Candidatus Sumerlaeia bacterium]
MKLRIKGNTIRLRLSKAEVETAAADGAIREVLHIPGGATFAYELRADATLSSPSASFDGATLAVLLSPDGLRTWATSDQVGVTAELPLNEEENLIVLVQKDFECLHRTSEEEDKADLYPHPGRKDDI